MSTNTANTVATASAAIPNTIATPVDSATGVANVDHRHIGYYFGPCYACTCGWRSEVYDEWKEHIAEIHRS